MTGDITSNKTNMKNIALGVMLLVIFGNIGINAEQYNREHPVVYVAEAKEVAPEEVLIEVKVNWTKERLREEVDTQAEKYGVSADQMWETLMCESGASTTIQSHHRRPDGTREQSYGVAQIYLPAHKNVTLEEALDPQFSIQFMAENFSHGNQKLWTCWKQLYGK